MSSFHLPIGEMTITMDYVSCLMHLPTRGQLLGHRRIDREETFKMMVTHLGANPAKASKEAADIGGGHARFSFFFGKTL